MSWPKTAAVFVYDFLADDGWELLVGLAIVLPLTFVVSGQSGFAGGVFMIAALLLTVAVSLGRRLPKTR